MQRKEQELFWHGVSSALWLGLLILAAWLYQGRAYQVLLGMGPVAIGLAAFWLLEDRSRGRTALLVGEISGIALGSTLLAGHNSPLALLLLWPIAQAALLSSLWTGLGLVTGAGLLYLAGGWFGPLDETTAGLQTGLSAVLYLVTFYGVFALLRSLKSQGAPESSQAHVATESTAPAATAATSNPGSAVSTASAPVATEQRAALTTPAGVPEEDPLHQDLRMARDIQVSLLLAGTPRLPGWEASTSFLPARELGGDLYDFVEIDPRHRGIMIGDVTGKGIPAALHMAVARTLFRMEAQRHPQPAETLNQVNRYLIEQAPQGCVTMLYACIDINQGAMVLSNAGHNYPLLLDGSVREIALDGLPLGIDNDYTYSETQTCLKPGDALVFYTDGIVEAMNKENEYFGFERLRELLGGRSSRRPRSLTRQIVRAVRSFVGDVPQMDDITLFVLRRRYTSAHEEAIAVANDVLGLEKGQIMAEQLAQLQIPADAPSESWRAAILTLGGFARDHWGQGLSRELMQQLFLSLEGL
ncbi:MAG: SpoIIE family protein phosphatase [Chloroflexia bacterium]|nr:SpoIIE family protein phosphatase [Chloroflexia bacterium]